MNNSTIKTIYMILNNFISPIAGALMLIGMLTPFVVYNPLGVDSLTRNFTFFDIICIENLPLFFGLILATLFSIFFGFIRFLSAIQIAKPEKNNRKVTFWIVFLAYISLMVAIACITFSITFLDYLYVPNLEKYLSVDVGIGMGLWISGIVINLIAPLLQVFLVYIVTAQVGKDVAKELFTVKPLIPLSFLNTQVQQTKNAPTQPAQNIQIEEPPITTTDSIEKQDDEMK